MSHQLKTPLNAILGFSETLLADPSLTDAEREAAATINASGKKLLSMIHDILDIEKIQTGRSTLEKKSVDMIHFVESVISSVKPKLKQHNVSLHISLSDGIPRYFLTDENKFFQAAVNFLTDFIESITSKNIFLTVNTRDKFLVFHVSNEPVSDSDHTNSVSFEPVINTQQRNLKPALIIGDLLVRTMGGQAFIRKISGHNAGFTFHIILERTGNNEIISGNNFDHSNMHSENITGDPYDISRIPEKLKGQIYDAVKRVRFDVLAGLIGEVETFDESFARRLNILAKDYNCESILEMLGKEI